MWVCLQPVQYQIPLTLMAPVSCSPPSLALPTLTCSTQPHLLRSPFNRPLFPSPCGSLPPSPTACHRVEQVLGRDWAARLERAAQPGAPPLFGTHDGAASLPPMSRDPGTIMR